MLYKLLILYHPVHRAHQQKNRKNKVLVRIILHLKNLLIHHNWRKMMIKKNRKRNKKRNRKKNKKRNKRNNKRSLNKRKEGIVGGEAWKIDGILVTKIEKIKNQLTLLNNPSINPQVVLISMMENKNYVMLKYWKPKTVSLN